MFTPIEREEELFRLWKSLPAPGFAFRALCGRRVVLISPGRRNSGPGPDFSDAVLLVEGALCVGPVEMHLREADWFAHGHQDDPAYERVVLHVLADDPPPERLRLAMPAVSARILIEGASRAASAEGTKEKEREEDSAMASRLSPSLLAELSWGRLLRRATEVLRDRREGESVEERIRRAFFFRLFDSLGYSRNRAPMKRTAATVWDALFSGGSFDAHGNMINRELPGFDDIAATVFAGAGIPAGRLEAIGRALMPPERLRRVLPPAVPQDEHDAPGWDYRGRPANAPERRLWGGAALTYDLLRNNLLEDLLEGLRRRRPFGRLAASFVVRLGKETVLGRPRAAEILINALCPVALAAGASGRDAALIEGACLTYRSAPSLAANRIVREVEERFGGENLEGAFLQQGAIEYYQRVLSPDRSGYSMIAEPPPGSDV